MHSQVILKMSSCWPRCLFAFVCLFFVLSISPIQAQSIATQPTARFEKRVLEWGWNTPQLQQMPAYLEAAQQTPFDGVIFQVGTPDDRRGLGWTVFGNQPVDQARLNWIAADLNGVNWGRLTDNFLIINVHPADVDWFDSFDTIFSNIEAIARLAHDIGFTGIMLDTEQYPGVSLFNYNRQTYRDQYPYAAYDAQVYLRGQELMHALNRGFPGLTLLYTFGLTMGSQYGARDLLPHHHYGLLTPFLEGMIEAADANTRLVDAFEVSYFYSREDQFAQAYDLVKNFTRDSYARNPARYSEIVQMGFGLFLDQNRCGSPSLQPPPDCPSEFTPDSFQGAVELALKYSDRYVWVYSQSVNWYTGEGIPPEWTAALNAFRQ